MLNLLYFNHISAVSGQQPSVYLTGDSLVSAGDVEARLRCTYTRAGNFQTLYRLWWSKGETIDSSIGIVSSSVSNDLAGDPFYIDRNSTLFPPERYSMTTDQLITGSSELVIKSIKHSDEGIYNCGVEFEEAFDGRFHDNIFLAVNGK